MGRPFIVENMPGANGSLAGGNVARSPSDGYTLMLAVDSNLVINPSLYHTLTYDPFKDFAPISIIARLNMVLVANPKIPASSVKELIAYAKANPNKLNYAEIGIGTGVDLQQWLARGCRCTSTDIRLCSTDNGCAASFQ